MARRRRPPWATVVTIVVCALVAAGALAMAASLRDRDTTPASADDTPPATTSGVGVDGCVTEPCTVLGSVPVGGNRIELVADRGNTSGRVRIGGAGSSEVIEVTITEKGAVLGQDALQCVPGSIVACLVRGTSDQGVIGQVVVGRTGKWNSLGTPFQSDAGYLALADVFGDAGAEILVAQHRCDRATVPDCSTTPVYVRVYNLRSEDKGCSRGYDSLDELPGWPAVTLRSTDVDPSRC
jgi:hypothetical protein